MSFIAHKRKIFDESESLEHRTSHARSCALLVANNLGVTREIVIELVAQKSGVDLHDPGSVERLILAFEALTAIRNGS